MCRVLLAWALGALPFEANATTSPRHDAAAPVASYRIDARLDADRHEITATSTIRWRNPSMAPTSELYLHTYLNAFSHHRTRFLRAGAARPRSASMLTKPGQITVTRFAAREFGDEDLLPRVAKHTPGDPDDATDLRVQLPGEVAPGGMLTLDLEFRAVLPSLVERTGFAGSFHAIAQWFPKIAYRDAVGTWHHFPYEPLAEFSSDFGDYDVTLDVPASFVIAAPGIAKPERALPARRREHYLVTSVHDFAWFAWDEFEVSKLAGTSCELRHYASREQSYNAKSTLELLRWGLDYFGDRFLPYPYATLTIVHPPDRARAAGGMEYPQLITTGGPWYFSRIGLRANEAVALHELAHQWFYGIIATDEHRYPVLDEGLASWAEAKALSARFGPGSFLDNVYLRVSEAAVRREIARKYTRRGPLDLAAGAFGDFSTLSGRVYARFPTLLETIERVYGADRLEAAVREYAASQRFRHPTPDDLLIAMRRSLPPRAVAAVATALHSDGWVDYAVREIKSARTSATGPFANRIRVERHGSFDFPVHLEVKFSDGRLARRLLENVGSSDWVEWNAPNAIVAATLDPDHLITIDDDLENQTIIAVGPRISSRLALALHLLLSAVLSLGWP